TPTFFLAASVALVALQSMSISPALALAITVRISCLISAVWRLGHRKHLRSFTAQPAVGLPRLQRCRASALKYTPLVNAIRDLQPLRRALQLGDQQRSFSDSRASVALRSVVLMHRSPVH